MINTFFGLERLDSPGAMAAALFIGLAFGFVLERAGFGSSRKLAGIFYFRDMTVLKVMFSAVITAMLGLSYALALGWISADQIYALPTVYRAQILGGLLFGVGFVASGWCPGTGAVGAASGKLDAIVFLLGAILGSVGFNEAFGVLQTLGVVPLTQDNGVLGDSSAAPVAFGISRPLFALLFTLVAVAAFRFAEWAEQLSGGVKRPSQRPILNAMSLAMIVFAVALFALPGDATPPPTAALLETIESAGDHLEPEDLAERLLRGEPDLTVVDVRPPSEFAAFHFRGAIRISLPDLPSALAPHKNRGTIVLYSNGMTHPAQARDILAQLGYKNVFLLTDGLNGFRDRCLKPVSLRDEPLSKKEAAKVNAWRAFFLNDSAPKAPTTHTKRIEGLVDCQWLNERLNRPDIRIIDVRQQPKYNGGHIPGAVCLNPESFRGVVGGQPSMLLPSDMLARHMSLMGTRPNDAVILVYGNVAGENDLGNNLRDATLVSMGLERLGHANWAILDGGFSAWEKQKLPVTTELPKVAISDYPAPPTPDSFTVNAAFVKSRIGDPKTVIVDSRPADYYLGNKRDEARGGHIPGAVNQPSKADLRDCEQIQSPDQLEAHYKKLIPNKDTEVVVHCRTGHQASQTYFILTRVLGYKNVKWYNGSWTEWSSNPELPVEK